MKILDGDSKVDKSQMGLGEGEGIKSLGAGLGVGSLGGSRELCNTYTWRTILVLLQIKKIKKVNVEHSCRGPLSPQRAQRCKAWQMEIVVAI